MIIILLYLEESYSYSLGTVFNSAIAEFSLYSVLLIWIFVALISEFSTLLWTVASQKMRDVSGSVLSGASLAVPNPIAVVFIKTGIN